MAKISAILAINYLEATLSGSGAFYVFMLSAIGFVAAVFILGYAIGSSK